MAQPIEYVTDNAGFDARLYKHSNGRKVSYPNTQVAALALFDRAVTGDPTTYDDVYLVLTAAMREWANRGGRRSKHRRFFQEHPEWTLHRYRAPMEFLKTWIEHEYPQLQWVPTTWIGAKEQLHLEVDVFEADKIILARLSADQVVPIVKGVAHFPWDPNSTLAHGKSRMVYGYWTQP
jgi:hypothetical protein